MRKGSGVSRCSEGHCHDLVSVFAIPERQEAESAAQPFRNEDKPLLYTSFVVRPGLFNGRIIKILGN